MPDSADLIRPCEDCGKPGVSWGDSVILCDNCALLRAKKEQAEQERTDDRFLADLEAAGTMSIMTTDERLELRVWLTIKGLSVTLSRLRGKGTGPEYFFGGRNLGRRKLLFRHVLDAEDIGRIRHWLPEHNDRSPDA
jgi:hypothetical protein